MKQVVVRAGLMGLALPLCGLTWLVVEERQRERVMTDFQTQLGQVKRGELEEVDLCAPEDVALFRELVRDFDPATSRVEIRDMFFSLTEVDVLTPSATYPVKIGRAEDGSGRVLARYVEKRAG